MQTKVIQRKWHFRKYIKFTSSLRAPQERQLLIEMKFSKFKKMQSMYRFRQSDREIRLAALSGPL